MLDYRLQDMFVLRLVGDDDAVVWAVSNEHLREAKQEFLEGTFERVSRRDGLGRPYDCE